MTSNDVVHENRVLTLGVNTQNLRTATRTIRQLTSTMR